MFENMGLSILEVWKSFLHYGIELINHPFKFVSLIIDILIVSFILYKFIIYAKKTRVGQLLKGIAFVLGAVVLSEVFQLKILNFILTFFMPYGVIALIVIFQPEFRRMLEQLGTNKLTKYFGINEEVVTKTKEDIYKIVIAAIELSKTKTGGLIVLEREIQIDDIIDNGVRIGAEVSPQLLVNIFTPKTPLHDGAVIISKNKIAAAACILPLANDNDIAKEIGTRHRAGLGISKESDAIAVIISEETGKISVAKEGNLIVDVNEKSLKNILLKNIVLKQFGNENKIKAINVKVNKKKIEKEKKKGKTEEKKQEKK